MRILYIIMTGSMMLATLSHASHAVPFMPAENLSPTQMCSAHFARAEQEFGLPSKVLHAIALTESGRYHKKAKRTIAWPWTLNVAGKGSYYDTMHDAATAVHRAQQRGVESIDVGCMQINLKHHPDAFRSVLDALDPASNVRYAAKFLRSNYDDLGTWPEAIAAYHSRNDVHGKPYYARVRSRWGDVQHSDAGLDHTLSFPSSGIAGEEASFQPSREFVNGVWTSRLTPSQPRRVNNGNREFEMTVRDQRISPTFKKLGKRSAPTPNTALHAKVQGESSSRMKVITVSSSYGRGNDAMVTRITPSVSRNPSLDGLSIQPPQQEYSQGGSKRIVLAYNDTSTPQEASRASVENNPSAPVNSKVTGDAPHFIFGRE